MSLEFKKTCQYCKKTFKGSIWWSSHSCGKKTTWMKKVITPLDDNHVQIGEVRYLITQVEDQQVYVPVECASQKS